MSMTRITANKSVQKRSTENTEMTTEAIITFLSAAAPFPTTECSGSKNRERTKTTQFFYITNLEKKLKLGISRV